MGEHILQTARLRLEPKREEHAAGTWNAIDRSLPELKRFMSWAADTTPVKVTEHMRMAEAEWADWTGWDWAVFLGDDVAGAVGLNRYDAMWRTANLGYWIRSDLAGRGLMTEAASAVVAFAFEKVYLNRLELVADVENLASQRVAEKVGFVYEGTKREGTWVAGHGIDVKLYGLLASDPRPGM